MQRKKLIFLFNIILYCRVGEWIGDKLHLWKLGTGWVATQTIRLSWCACVHSLYMYDMVFRFLWITKIFLLHRNCSKCVYDYIHVIRNRPNTRNQNKTKWQHYLHFVCLSFSLSLFLIILYVPCHVADSFSCIDPTQGSFSHKQKVTTTSNIMFCQCDGAKSGLHSFVPQIDNCMFISVTQTLTWHWKWTHLWWTAFLSLFSNQINSNWRSLEDVCETVWLLIGRWFSMVRCAKRQQLIRQCTSHDTFPKLCVMNKLFYYYIIMP